MKEKMFKGLSESERKAIEDYINEQKAKGKEESEIMKEAGTASLLFFVLMVVILFAMIIGVFVLVNGDLNKLA